MVGIMDTQLVAVPTAMVFAQAGGGVGLPGPGDTVLGQTPDQSGIIKFICVIFNYAFFALLLAAVGFVLYAAFRYLTAAGDPAKVTVANKTLIFAAVAIAVALVARAVPVIVGNFVLSNGGGTSFDVCAQ
jgi:magnesium-transporting ATPase (P-type)